MICISILYSIGSKNRFWAIKAIRYIRYEINRWRSTIIRLICYNRYIGWRHVSSTLNTNRARITTLRTQNIDSSNSCYPTLMVISAIRIKLNRNGIPSRCYNTRREYITIYSNKCTSSSYCTIINLNIILTSPCTIGLHIEKIIKINLYNMTSRWHYKLLLRHYI